MSDTVKRPSDAELATMLRAAAITIRHPNDPDLSEYRSDLLTDLDGAADALEAAASEPFTSDDAMRVRGAARFARDMSNGQASRQALDALYTIADKIERAAGVED